MNGRMTTNISPYNFVVAMIENYSKRMQLFPYLSFQRIIVHSMDCTRLVYK